VAYWSCIAFVAWSSACASSPRARALRAVDDGAWEVAATAYREAIAASPQDASLWVELGRVHLRLNEAAQARAVFERAARLGDSARTRILIGRTHELERHYDEALVAYRQATELDPGNAYAWRYAGARLLRWGDAAAAEPWLTRAVELDPAHAETWNALGIARAEQRNVAGAEATFRSGLELHPEHRGLWLGLAAVLINATRMTDALAVYDEVIERWPGFGAAHVGRGLLLDTLGRSAEAEAAFDQAVAAEPNNVSYQRRLTEYRAQHRADLH